MSWRLSAHITATRIVSALPRGLSYRTARCVGTLISLPPSSRKRVLTGNIAVAHGLPENHPRVHRDVRRAFQHAMLNYVDLFGLERHDAPELIDSIRVDDWSPYVRAEEKGKGVILFSAHLGNYDTVVQKLAIRGRRVLIPVENIEPRDLLNALRARRAALGMDIAPVGPDTFKQMAAHVRSGGTVVIVCDRDIQGTGVPVTFLCRQARLPQAAVLLALRTGAPILGAFGYRFDDNSISGRLTAEIDVGRGQAGDRTTSLRQAVEQGMKALVSVLEREIRSDPGQWVMQQPVFAAHGAGALAKPVLEVKPAHRRIALPIHVAARALVPSGGKRG